MNPETKKPEFSEKARKKIEEILTHYPDKRSALLPVLNLAQAEFGYISEEVTVMVARLLDLTPPKVYEVLTFYTLLNDRPVGRYLIQFCRTLSCALVGSETVLGHLKQRLGIEVGETTPDGLFTLRTVECLASCGTAPVMQVNGVFYEKLTREKMDRILDDLKRGDPPVPKPMGEN
ncbi:MAG TPA: NADH-quinone oxidoreductase subunit NuoE [Nitrospiria bacterium]|nr:NADH-quinone oxidoreductase subunit NuoE [Nitrospiria bacterium]